MTHTCESLTAFTERVRTAFLAKQIRAPVHLCDPAQAEPLIEIFQNIRPQDYVFATWRSMFHALLKGWPADEVFAEIIAGRSMYLMSKQYRFMAGSIVGGMLPIALGVAAGIKRDCDSSTNPHWIATTPRVWAFCGDMAARSGLFHEFREYAIGHDLPVRIVVEDNFYSTDSKTSETWGTEGKSVDIIVRYEYSRTVPHVGCGSHVQF